MPRGSLKLATTLAAALLALASLRPRPASPALQVVARPAAAAWRTLAGQPPVFEPWELRHDRRQGATLAGSGRWRLSLSLPAAARLRFSWSVEPRGVAAAMSWREASSGRLLHDELHAEGETWLDRELDLHDLGPGSRELELSLDAPGARVHVSDLKLLAPASQPLPNVILYVVDCLRADHVGAYGYARPTTPRLDALAREGVLFEQAMACASWTKPSIGCLFTSLYGPEHGAQTVDDVLGAGPTTLAELFGGQGYGTSAWVDNPFVASRTFGLSRGFDRVAQVTARAPGLNINDLPSDAGQLTLRAQRWLERHADERFFLYLHSLDLHAAYRPRPGFTRRVAPGDKSQWTERDLYDGELAANDAAIGTLLDTLKRAGLYDRTLIVVTADHGEEFGEHGTSRHGKSLFQDLLHVPLVVKPAGFRQAALRVPEPVSNIDIAPTLLDLAGLPRPAGFRGLSLRPLMEGRGAPPGRVLFATQLGPREALYAARRGRYKVIRQLLPRPSLSFYDLEADPREGSPLGAPSSELRTLQQDLDRLVQAGQAGWHVIVGDPNPDARVRVQAATPDGFAEVQRFDLDLEDGLALSPGNRRMTYTFQSGGTWRHLALRPNVAGAPLEISVSMSGRPLAPSDWRLGPLGQPGQEQPVLIEATQALAAFEQVPALIADRAPGVRVWYQAPPGARADVTDPELEESLRALGYIQ